MYRNLKHKFCTSILILFLVFGSDGWLVFKFDQNSS